MANQIDHAGKHEIRPIAGLLPQADPQNMEMIYPVESTKRVALGRSGLLSLDLVSDHFAALSVSFLVISDVLALRQQPPIRTREPNTEVRVPVLV